MYTKWLEMHVIRAYWSRQRKIHNPITPLLKFLGIFCFQPNIFQEICLLFFGTTKHRDHSTRRMFEKKKKNKRLKQNTHNHHHQSTQTFLMNSLPRLMTLSMQRAISAQWVTFEFGADLECFFSPWFLPSVHHRHSAGTDETYVVELRRSSDLRPYPY